LPAVHKNYQNSLQLHSSQSAALPGDPSSYERSTAEEQRGLPPLYPALFFIISLKGQLISHTYSQFLPLRNAVLGADTAGQLILGIYPQLNQKFCSVGRLKHTALNVADKHFSAG